MSTVMWCGLRICPHIWTSVGCRWATNCCSLHILHYLHCVRRSMNQLKAFHQAVPRPFWPVMQKTEHQPCSSAGVSLEPSYHMPWLFLSYFCGMITACCFWDIFGFTLQTYIINQAKVMFLNQRPQSKMGRPGAPDACVTCARTLREGCSYCSLACKVEALVAAGKLLMPTSGAACASDSGSEGWPIQPNDYRKLYEQENASTQQLQEGTSGDSSSSQQLWGEHRPHVHVGATAAWLRRNSDDSSSSGSYCSRRKQFSPRRSPLL